MDVNDLILVSVDDHVVEPPDMWEGHLSERFRDEAPKHVRKDDGTDVWAYQGTELPNIGLNAVAGRPKEEYGVDPTSYEEMRPGCYDVHDRVKDMSAGSAMWSSTLIRIRSSRFMDPVQLELLVRVKSRSDHANRAK